MTERGLPIVDGAPACPFVALDDDRDERATSPDHRHRCYAEDPPAPRALAHQEAYCLASAFPVCPTFQDWARREAARPSGPGGSSLAAGDRGPAAGARDDVPQRNPPRSWSAPPPWVAGGPAEGGGAGAGDGWADEDDDDLGAPVGARGLSGSFADRLTTTGPGADEPSDSGSEAAAAGRPEDRGHAPDFDEPDFDEPESQPAHRRRDREVEGAPILRRGEGRDRGAARGEQERRSDRRREAPEWERPRRMEAYPTLRSRRLPEVSLPPVLLGFVALLLAAAVLFALPGLLGFGSPQAGASGTPTLPVQTGIPPTPEPTPIPPPTPFLYTVQQGDTMSRIAGRFGIPLGDLIAANAENIPDPDKLQIGDQVIIPVPTPTQLPGATEGPAAS